MIEDIAQHMREDHEYEPAVLDDDATLWRLHAHFHGERLTATQASRFFSTSSEETHVSERLDDDARESESQYAARLLREHGVRGS